MNVILLHDLALPLLSFVIMTIYHEIPRLSVIKIPGSELDCEGFAVNDQRRCF